MHTRTIRYLLPPLLLAAASASAGEGPRLQVDQKELDFGEVIQGRQVEEHVKLTNAGDAPLKITRASASCECTVGSYPEDPIAPGKSGDLVLRFDSNRKRGMQSFTIEVYSNDPSQHDRGPFCTLITMRGEVRTLYRLKPGGAFFGEFVRGREPATRTVKIQGQDEAKGGFTAKLVSKLPDYLQAEVVQDGKYVDLKVTLLPQVPRGELEHVLELETSVKEQPRLQLPLVAIVTGSINGPDFVQLMRIQRGSKLERRVPLERRDGGSGIPLVGLQVDERYLTAQVEEISSERLDVVLHLAPKAPPGIFATVLRIQLDDPDEPLLEIPVFGQLLPRVRVEPTGVLLKPGDASPFPLSIRGGKVLGVTAPEGLEAKVVEAGGADAPARVEVRLTGQPPEHTELTLQTDVEGEEHVAVPVRLMPGD